MALDTIGSIAIHINSVLSNLSDGVSGTLVETVDLIRQHVSNYTGQTIGSNSIEAKFQPAILNLSIAETINLTQSQGSDDLKLAELSIAGTSEQASAKFFQSKGESHLNALGQKRYFARSLS